MILSKIKNYRKLHKFLRKLHDILPRYVLLTIYKLFVRPHLHYDDIIYDQANNAAFHKILELMQRNVLPQYLFKLIPMSSSG